jgi:CDP-paratose synthetase
MKILLTGSSGYLGSRLAKHWLSEGHTLCLMLRNSSDIYRLEGVANHKNIKRFSNDHDIAKIISVFKPEFIVHTASCYGRSGESLNDIYMSNIHFGMVILDAISKCSKPPSFININTSLNSAVNYYAKSKNEFASWGNIYASKSLNGLNFFDIKLQQFYGEEDDESKLPSKVIRACLRNDSSLDLTHGNQIRDFIYIDDVVSALDMVLSQNKNFTGYSSIEIGCGIGVTVKSFIETIKFLSNSKTNLVFGSVNTRTNEPKELVANTKILKSLGWRPFYNLEMGITKTIDFERNFLSIKNEYTRQ